MSDDTPTLEPDPYHKLSGSQRDHLLAAALHRANAGAIPTTGATADAVGRLTGTRPHNQTTADAIRELVDVGHVERVKDDPKPQARGVRVTPDGYRALARGAARLDTAATIRGDEGA